MCKSNIHKERFHHAWETMSAQPNREADMVVKEQGSFHSSRAQALWNDAGDMPVPYKSYRVCLHAILCKHARGIRFCVNRSIPVHLHPWSVGEDRRANRQQVNWMLNMHGSRDHDLTARDNFKGHDPSPPWANEASH